MSRSYMLIVINEVQIKYLELIMQILFHQLPHGFMDLIQLIYLQDTHTLKARR
jgi:hypothetical protein